MLSNVIFRWYHGHERLPQQDGGTTNLVGVESPILEMREFSAFHSEHSSTALEGGEAAFGSDRWNWVHKNSRGKLVVLTATMAALVFALMATARTSSSGTSTGSADTSNNQLASGSPDTNSHLADIVPVSKSFLPEFTLETIISNPTSPQARALEWVQNHPDFESFPDWRCRQLVALLSLCGNDADVVSYDLPECQWALRDTPNCTAEGKYQQLHMEGYQLTGSVPPEVSLLPALTSLNLFNNHLTGSLPTQLGVLTALQSLKLEDNYFEGALPSQVGLLTALTWLNLFANRLVGTLPSQLGQMTALTKLGLGINRLEGPLPSQIGKLKRLEFIDLLNNRLTGQLPSQLGKMGMAFTYLNMANNHVKGTIPSQMGQLSALTTLRLEGNQLTGPIPTELGLLSELQELNLANNALGGVLPWELEGLTHLSSCHLENNQFTGNDFAEAPLDLHLHSVCSL